MNIKGNNPMRAVVHIEEKNPMHDGNLFFKHKYPTIDLENRIQYLDSFEAFEKYYTDELMDENRLLAEYLYHLIEKYGSNPNEVSKMIGKSHDYVRQLVTGIKQDPKRDSILAICVYLGVTVDETQILLRYSGNQPLYARRKRDALIWFALKKHQKLYDLDTYLFENGYITLGKYSDKKK